MSTPDFAALAAGIARCNAAYTVDPNQAARAFAALGSTFLDQYRDSGHQAVLSHDATGQVRLTIAGTRISEGPLPDRIGDLIKDIDWTPREVAPGIFVARGAFAGMDKVCAWVASIAVLDELNPIAIEGHSLGGWRAPYVARFLPRSHIGSIIQWEPPKSGNAAFWAGLAGTDITTIIHGRDPWVAWPWTVGDSLSQRPGRSLLWLHDGAWEMTSEKEWPGVDPFDPAFDDHEPASVMRAVNKLAKDQVPA